ncbi:hypothetical protein CI238_12855 [Colletotrichum incanum]|uniref:Uncharacterized protein n=1 Tax=Colletotrichum incanum TaxID=1573173 RepID=A0A161YEC5_COLIC|nr:hypothetical protein CI238_12855 [Colletotrichum incanum]
MSSVAARGGLIASMHNPQNQRPSQVQTLREVIVNIRDPTTIASIRAMNPRNLKAHVDRAIKQSSNKHIRKLKTVSDNKAFIPTVEIKTYNPRVPLEKRHGHTPEVRGMPRQTQSVARPVPNQDTGTSQNQSGIQTTTKVPPGSHNSPNRHRNGPNNPDDIKASTRTKPEPEHTPKA